jgi:hypothetical protein
VLFLVQVCRLFDLFLATHPLMPLYVGAAAMHSQRQQLLAAEEMPILHSKLVNLSVTKMATADQLAIQVCGRWRSGRACMVLRSSKCSAGHETWHASMHGVLTVRMPQ